MICCEFAIVQWQQQGQFSHCTMSIIMAFYFWVGKKLPVLYIDC